MSNGPRLDVERIFLEHTLVDEVLAQATREAVRQHVQAGNPIAVEENGQVRLLASSEVDLAKYGLRGC